MSKKRSIPYPSKTLLEVKPFVVAIFNSVGGQLELQYDDMAKYGEVPKRESPYFASTASQYGWSESVYGKGHKINGDICKILRKPQGDEEAEILKKAFITPEIYQHIIQEWNGKQIQSIDAIEIYLGRNHNFTDTGATQCAEIFIENAKALGLIDADNYFNIDAVISISNPEPKNNKPKSGKVIGEKNGKKKPAIDNKSDTIQKPDLVQPGVKKIKVWIRSKELLVPILEDMNAEDWNAFLSQLQDKKNG